MREAYLGSRDTYAGLEDILAAPRKSADIRETFMSEPPRSECYVQCMSDAWDLKGESVCGSVCAVS